MVQEFTQGINVTIQTALEGVHTAFPGTFVSYNPNTNTGTIKPAIGFKKPNGDTLDYPNISGVPVVFPQAYSQQATVAFPIKAGDGCLVIVAEQSIDEWMYGQKTDTDLTHDLTNSICIPGLFSAVNSVEVEACDQNAVIVDLSGTRITVRSGEVVIDASKVTINGNVQVNGKVDATGDVKANSSISLATHTHGGCSGGSTSGPK